MPTHLQVLIRGDRRLSTVSASVLIALFSVGAAGSAPALWATDGPRHALAAEGERWWSTSPDPTNPVACESCHRVPEVAGRVLAFPRLREGRPEPVESFLENHRPLTPRLRWDGQEVADLMAALMARIAGRPLGDPAVAGRKEE